MEQFLIILSSQPVGICICEGDITLYINKQFKLFFGDPGDIDERIVTNLKNIMLERKIEGGEFKVFFGNKDLLIQASKISDTQDMYVATDITKIEQLNIMELKNQHKKKLLLSFTHEFRTPLQWLNGSLSSIVVSTSDQAELLKTAKHATNMLTFYMEDMINFNSMGESKDEQINKKMSMHKCIKECFLFVDIDIKLKNAKCKCSISEDVPLYVIGNPTLYKQISNNILCNSIKSCPENLGLICLSVHLRNHCIYTTISDNAPGLSNEEITQILNPMEKGGNADLQVRHGLGMLLCRDLCKRLGGDLMINSCLDQGTVYTYWFPLKLPMVTRKTTVDIITDDNNFLIEDDQMNVVENNAAIAMQPPISVRKKKSTANTASVYDPRKTSDAGHPKIQPSTLNIVAYNTSNLIDNSPQREYAPIKKEESKGDFPKFDINKADTIGSHIEEIVINVKSDSPIKEEEKKTKLDANKKSKATLLIVDDTKFNNTVLKQMLKTQGVDCVECSNGKEAVDNVVACGNMIPYPLIFMDINMPVMDGLEVKKCLGYIAYQEAFKAERSERYYYSSTDGTKRWRHNKKGPSFWSKRFW